MSHLPDWLYEKINDEFGQTGVEAVEKYWFDIIAVNSKKILVEAFQLIENVNKIRNKYQA